MKQCYTLTGLDVLGKIRSYIRLLTVILLYVTFALPASAQGGGKAVSGIVKDDTGNPLIGVTVTVPGTTKGTTTDANGTYTINADNSESLNFSYVGYKPQTIHVNNQADVVTVTSPEAIFLFGGLSKAGKLIFEPTQWYMEENMLFAFKNKVKLLPSGIQGKNAAILGASALIWQEEHK